MSQLILSKTKAKSESGAFFALKDYIGFIEDDSVLSGS